MRERKESMIHIAVVEDEKQFSETLKQYIQQYMAETHVLLECDAFTDGIHFVEDYSGKYQIVFMDIAMPHMDGMTAAAKIREIDRDVCLIFMTSMAQYAIRGYEVAALDFVVKPVEYELFKIKLEKAISHIKVNEFYTIKSSDGIRKINLKDLVYIESSKHYLHFHTCSNMFRMRGSMREIEETFSEKGFAFVNSSILVNLAYVEAMTGNLIDVSGEQMKLARAYKITFREKLAAYLGGL